MIKKLFIFMLAILFSISFISAWDITLNNVKEYDASTQTVTISDNYLITKVTIAEVKLDTPLIYNVMHGKDRKVFQFTVNSYGDYLSAISGMELINNKDGKAITRDINYKYLTLESYEVDVNDYKEVYDDKNNSYSQELIGTHKETRQREVWNKLNSLNIPKGNLTIGGFTDVEVGDNIEWIPTMFGVDVEEWATWTDSFNVGLTLYYDMNSSKNLIDGTYNISTTSGTVSYNTTQALIGNAMQFPATNSEANINRPPVFNFTKNSTSFNFWFRIALGGDNILIRDDVSGAQINVFSGSASLNGATWGAAGAFATFSANTWTMLTYVKNNSATYWYQNGNLIKTYGAPDNSGARMNFLFGRAANPSVTGQFDEFGAWNRTLTPTEITNLYNGGAGLTYIGTTATADLYPTFTNSAQFPVNNTQYLKNRNYNFNVTILDSNGTAGIEWNGANYSVTNLTNLYNRSFTDLGAGNYNYYYWAYGNGTSHFFNRSLTYDYTINKSALTFTTNVTTPITEGTASNYVGIVERPSSTTVLDMSGNSNTGTAIGGVAINSTYAKFGNGGASFDGVDDAINTTAGNNQNFNGTGLSNGFTLSAWINPNSKGETSGHIVAKSTGANGQGGFFWAMDTSTNRITFQLNAGSAVKSADNSIPFENWTHILIIINSSNIGQQYVNGNASGSAINTVQLISNITTTNPLTIGQRSGATDRTFNGSIDEVRIFNRTLSQAEITSLYTSNTIADTTGLVAYYDMNSNLDATCNATLWRNSVPIASGTSVSDTSVLVPNTYTYNYSVINCGNYTNAEDIETLIVQEIFKNINITLISPVNGTQTTNSNIALNYVINLTNSNLTNYTLYVWFSNGTIAHQDTTLTGSLINVTINHTDFTYLNSVYFWNVYATGLESNNSLISKWATNNGSFTIDNTNPNGTLISPLNGSYTNATQNFTANISDNVEVTNYTLYIYNQTDLVNKTIGTGNWLQGLIGVTVTLLDDVYNWFYEIRDTTNNYFTTENRTFVVDTTYPTIAYGTGTEIDYANVTHKNIYINTTWTETNFRNITFRAGNQKQDYFTATYLHNFTSFADGTYTYNVTICDQGLNCNTTASRTITIDNTAPSITILAPTILSKVDAGFNASLNYTITEGLSGVQSCWFNYNNVNTSLSCNNDSFFITNQVNLTLYANDTSGNVMSDYHEFIIIKNITYNPSAYAGVYENFNLSIVYPTSYSGISAYFNYNNTNYTTSLIGSAGNYTLSSSLITPATAINTNKTLYYVVTLTNSSGNLVITTDYYNQTLNPFNIDNCTYVNSFNLMNITIHDEKTMANITGTVDLTIKMYPSPYTNLLLFTYNGSYAYNGINPIQICTTNMTTNYSMFYTMKYYSNESTYFIKYRNAQNIQVSNISTQIIKLYDLLGTQGYQFKISLRGLTSNDGYLIDVQREYPALNSFISVAVPLTDAAGEATTPLVQNDVVYNFVVSKNGVNIGTFNNYQVKCNNYATLDCAIILALGEATAQVTDFTNMGGVSGVYLLDSNNSKIYYTFQTTDSTVKNVTITASLLGSFDNTTLGVGSLTASSGTITIDIPTALSNQSYAIETYVNGRYVQTNDFTMGTSPNWYGVMVFLQLLLFTALVMMFSFEPKIMIMGGIVGMILSLILFQLGSENVWTYISIGIFYLGAGIASIIKMKRGYG